MLQIPVLIQNTLKENGSGVISGHFSANFRFKDLQDAYLRQLNGDETVTVKMVINLSLGVNPLGTIEGSCENLFLSQDEGGLGHCYNEELRRFCLLIPGEKQKMRLYLEFFEWDTKFGSFLATTAF